MAVLTILVALVVAVWALFRFGPYEEVDLNASFEPRKFGEGVGVYFESVESAFPDIWPGVEKRVVWAGPRETRTPVSILYVHGFSASSEEIRPVPDQIATALGANLVYTRLTGHGRTGAAMAEATARAWMQDMAEGIAAARAVGDRVVVIGTSTGGTLALAAALDPDLSKDVAAVVLVSPNLGVNSPVARFMTWPFARHLMALTSGRIRHVEGRTSAQEDYWTNDYPISAVTVMAALVKAVNALDAGQGTAPLLVRFSDDDQVVVAADTRAFVDRWGGPVTLQAVPGDRIDDPWNHVIAGDLASPNQNAPAVAEITGWLRQVLGL
ncbi:alpha/beta hydrolase [Chachezhania sediminis]|uniref:alpha/beta hydrolase n=1 Tax=Chachezhania sediminis TaxID=2599291 RepID=UPI001E2E05E5|nr:alpha/beta fold hydrolase [Chachezhania sediminis]